MRIQDVLDPYIAGTSRVVESHRGSLAIGSYVTLPPGVAYERRAGDGEVRGTAEETDTSAGRVLELAIYGPDLSLHGPESDVLDSIRRLELGDRCAILFGYETHALPFHRLLDDLTVAHAQVLQVSALDYEHIHAAAIITVSDRLVVPHDLLGEPLTPDLDRDEGDPVFFRIANEFVFTEFVLRNLRAQLYHAEADTGRAAVETDGIDRDLQQARVEADRARAETERAKAEQQRIVASTSYQLGRTLVDTARGRRPILGLPRTLVRMWRSGGGRDDGSVVASAGPRTRGSRSAIALPDGGVTFRAEDRRFLSDSAVAITARTRPVVLGIISDPTAGALASDAIVNRVTPNDALLALERSEPDLVLVEAAALAPSYPWAYAANAAAVERASLLTEIVERAQRMGRPAVLVRDLRSADHVGLLPLEPIFDLVIDAGHGTDGAAGWSRGAQLARFNPLGAPEERGRRPLFIGGLDPRAPIRERRFIESVLAAARAYDLEMGIDADAPIGWDAVPEDLRGSSVGRVPWFGLAPVYRRTSLVISNPFTDRDRELAVDARVLEQLASGTRIVSGPNRALEGIAEAHVTVVRDRADATRGISAALDAGAPTSVQMRAMLRVLFLDHASAVMLSRITRRLGISVDPLSDRSITTVVDLSADSDVGRIVSSTTDQIQGPTRTVVRLGDGATWSGTADAAMANVGIDVEVQTADAHRHDWSRLESDETTEWLSLWPQGRSVPSTYLLDLLVGGEMSRADAVGYGSDPGFHFVPRLGQASIVRRDALRQAGAWRPPFVDDRSSLADWERHGWRLLSVGPEDLT